MRFSNLEESGLGITREDISTLFEPFVVKEFERSAPEWRAEIAKRKRSILRKYIKRLLFRWSPSTHRNEKAIIDEYSKAWKPGEYENYRLGGPIPRVSPWEYLDRGLFASDVGGTRFRQLLLIRMIEKIKPKRVLEVGCGNGINLIMLACRFPEIEFAGLELTQEGHLTAVEMQKQAVLPEAIQEYAPLPLKDPTAFRNIRFAQGSAENMPFQDGEFDLVYTILALEQMERIRDKALSEIARVAASHTLMFEPFRDVNTGWARANIIRRNYFRGPIDDLPRYGLKPVTAIRDFPQESFLKACAVLSEKQ
jgi:SAM-dependent methyltransferase